MKQTTAMLWEHNGDVAVVLPGGKIWLCHPWLSFRNGLAGQWMTSYGPFPECQPPRVPAG